jgi:hypothetical protein
MGDRFDLTIPPSRTANINGFVKIRFPQVKGSDSLQLKDYFLIFVYVLGENPGGLVLGCKGFNRGFKVLI